MPPLCFPDSVPLPASVPSGCPSAAFDDLSADVRRKFDNDPQQFLEYVNNPDNRESLYDLGLAIRPLADSGVAASGLPASAEGDPILT